MYLVLCLQVISPHLVGNFDDEVAPEEVEDEEGGEEEVEDIVGGEHGQDLSRLYAASNQRLNFLSYDYCALGGRKAQKHWMLDKIIVSSNTIDGFSSTVAAAVVNWHLSGSVHLHFLSFLLCKEEQAEATCKTMLSFNVALQIFHICFQFYVQL